MYEVVLQGQRGEYLNTVTHSLAQLNRYLTHIPKFVGLHPTLAKDKGDKSCVIDYKQPSIGCTLFYDPKGSEKITCQNRSANEGTV